MGQCVLDPQLVADQQEFEAIMAAPGDRRAFDHHAHAFVSAHRIDSDTR
jgi:hypothetical protein